MHKMTFDESIRWLDDFQKFGIKLGLERIQTLVGSIGHPERKLRCIHVTGTNGKGSVCRYITSVLLAAGYTVGLYVSPHLETILERFSLNNKMISEEEFSDLASIIRQEVDTLIREGITPTYFEITTAMMFLWFAEKDVDYAVIEVGLGGRFDATNIIFPILSVITNISLDHTQILGDTIEKIAFEKAGIIKHNVPVITATRESALSIIQKEAEKHHAPIYTVKKSSASIISSDEHGQTIHVSSLYHDFTVETQNLGVYQIENVLVALYALEVLQTQGVFLPENAIETGIKDMKHPGRMEVVHQQPLIILDGAHNPSAMELLSRTIKELFAERYIIVVFGVMADKAVDDIIINLLFFADHIIATRPETTRAMKAKDIQKHIMKFSKDITITISDTIPDGIQQAVTLADANDIILVTGSFFTVGEARRYLREHQANI